MSEPFLLERVLVTGGHGVIGSWVCRELARQGHVPIALDRVPQPRLTFSDAPLAPAVVADIRDTDTLRAILASEGITRVVHLAAIVGRRADEAPVDAIEVNASATVVLLRLAREFRIRRVVVLSTKGVLGHLPGRFLHPTYDPVPTDWPAAPTSLYDGTKLLVEIAVRGARDGGLDCSAIRLATTWGPGKGAETHAGFALHSDLVEAVLRDEPVELEIGPEYGHDLVYYGDVAAGLVAAALARTSLRDPVYHLGSGTVVTLGEFVDALVTIVPGARVRLGDQPPPGRNCRLDITSSRRDFGYRPGWHLRAALRDFVRRRTPSRP